MKVVLVYQLFIRRVSHFTIRWHKNYPSKQLKSGGKSGGRQFLKAGSDNEERETGNGERGIIT